MPWRSRRSTTLPPGLLAQTEVLDGHASAVVSRTTDRSIPRHHAAWRAVSLALAYHALGRTAEARRPFEDLVARYAHNMPFQIAEVAAWQGDPNAAFWWLERAAERLDTGIYVIRISPFLRSSIPTPAGRRCSGS